MRAGGGLSGATDRVIASSSESHCAVLCPLLATSRAGQLASRVLLYQTRELGGGCPKMMDFTQQDGDPVLSSEINFMGYDQHYHTHYAHTRARTRTHTHTVEYTSGYGKQ